VKRYLIHHGAGGTWDLVVTAGRYTVEHTAATDKKTYTLEEFEKSADGRRLAQDLALAVERAKAA
jgi:hypothetical protein